MEIDATGRTSGQSDGVTGIRSSVWETRMRIDQVNGGIKVFGGSEQENDGAGGGGMYARHLGKHDDGEDSEMGAPVAGGSPVPVKTNGVRGGGKRRMWKPLPESFESPILEKPGRTETSPAEVKKSGSESTDAPAMKDYYTESKMGRFEFLQKSGQMISNGAPSCGSTDVSDYGSPGNVSVVKSNNKSTTSSHDNLHRESSNSAGQFRFGREVLGCNDGVNDDGEEEEIFQVKKVSPAEREHNAAFLKENKVRVGLFSEKKLMKPISAPAIKQPPDPSPVSKRSTVHQSHAKGSAYGSKYDSEKHNILDSLLDLVMWRDAPKSAICFGSGTFILTTSSYMNDPNMSFISAVSHLGLACLAAIFFYRSIIWRGYAEVDDTLFHDLEEEELLSLTKFFLPYLNDLLRSFKALLSGDAAVTMKLAVLFFVLARCGSFLTMWNMMKLGFFTAFTIPKLWSLYYNRLADQGKHCLRVSQDIWDSCPHRKAVAAVAIILVLGYSSNITRIWAGLILLLAFRYHRQSLVRDGSSTGFEELKRSGKSILRL
ncbi:hypothetical protein SAY86_030612 [Trapa natans]|uniref:Reticulon-like protein n=1 Tax=Trapa natans TaxID=22666 RepID=A0AAN7RHA6_TRANT|nr:hypothetical protein SAY86_030612 [Trapa natans]